MRYRPFGRTGVATSCVSLALTGEPMSAQQRTALIYAALESGINTFELQTFDPEVARALGEAVSAVDRRMVFIGLRIGGGGDGRGGPIAALGEAAVVAAIRSTLAHAGLDWLDVVSLELAEDEAPPAGVVKVLQAAQRARRARLLSLSSGGAAAEPHLGGGVFEVVSMPFSIESGWRERNRLKRAIETETAVIGYGFFPFGDSAPPPPEAAPSGRPAGLFRLGRFLGGGPPRKEVADSPYAFLERTGGWTAEEICLGYALTEPALATVQCAATDPKHLQALAAVAERELPTGVTAQIEMARFSGPELHGAA